MSRYFIYILPILLTSALLPANASAQDDPDDILRQYDVYDIVKQYETPDDEYPRAQDYDSELPEHPQYAPVLVQPAPGTPQWNRPSRPHPSTTYTPPSPSPAQPQQYISPKQIPAYPQIQPHPSPASNQKVTYETTGDQDLDALLNEAYQLIGDIQPGQSYTVTVEYERSGNMADPQNTKITKTITPQPSPAPTAPARPVTSSIPQPHTPQPQQTAPIPAKPQIKTDPKPLPSAPKANPAPSTIVTSHTGAVSYRSLLSNYEQKLYDPILKAIQERRVSVNVSGDLSSDIMKRVIEAITNDHPEIFWMSESFSHEKTLSGQQVTNTEIIFGYNQLVYSADQSAQAFASATSQIVNNARAAGSALAMEKYVHDYLASHVTYGSNALDQTAYGAIVNHYAVCAGFARAFKSLMDQLGIPCYVVSGMQATSDGNTESHAWNLVYINGKCYNVDVTSDLIEIQKGRSTSVQVDYRLFNKTDDEFKKMGYIRESEYSNSAFNLPRCN
ncbi:MAG: hypothetical protein IJ165_07085 [Proteobacteria bacterium]|nr:hypothetical protein [Pseudomonadota bacterium]